MIPFFVLIVSLLVFRGLGAAGVDVLSSWPAATRFALAVMFLFTASAHGVLIPIHETPPN